MANHERRRPRSRLRVVDARGHRPSHSSAGRGNAVRLLIRGLLRVLREPSPPGTGKLAMPVREQVEADPSERSC